VSILYPLLRVASHYAAPAGAHARLPILYYHRVLPATDLLLPTEPDAATFDAHMRMVSSVFRVLPLDEAIERLRAGTLPARSACITFDDGYRNNFEIACPILRKYGLVATFFVATGYLGSGRMFNDTVIEAVRRLPTGRIDLSWIGLGVRDIHDNASRAQLFAEFVNAVKYLPSDERLLASRMLTSKAQDHLPVDIMMTIEQVQDLPRQGMSVGGHTVDHPILVNLPAQEARDQISENRDELATIIGTAPTLFAYPNGKPGIDYAIEHVRMVEEAGYTAAFSTGWGVATRHSDRFQLPRIAPWGQNPLRFGASMIYHTGFATHAAEVTGTWRRPDASPI
jgi:peptidoglycan/xylan/chitin deacetylase (PgdA/CDA1 family)